MEKDILEKYMLSGKIASEARELGRKMVAPGVSYLEVAEKVEAHILERGARIAFPANISVNDVAAHYTPSANDSSTFSEKDVVKIDVGAHVDGYIADTACTVCLDPEMQNMAEAIDLALENAIKIIKPGVNIGEIGETIENTIRSAGYKPISNLSGHMLDCYKLHAGLSIPNIKVRTKATLSEGDAVAIEPFLTDGGGAIRESRESLIFRFAGARPVRSNLARQIITEAKAYSGLPFAERNLKSASGFMLSSTLRQLVSIGAIEDYPVLKEVNSGIVAQAEHTVIVSEKPIVTTR